jgi:DNA-binding transcriptional regulator LsrR (DeoR family)
MDESKIKLIAKVARLYYEDGKTQEEIGKELGISRFKVLRLLQKAREEGIISIKIIDPSSTCKDLEQALEKKFNLERAIVVSSGYLPKTLILQEIGKWGALLLQDITQNGDIIGIGWGSTVSECIRQLNPNHKEVTVIPLGGGTGQLDPIFQVNELSKWVANKFKAKWYSLDIPIFLENREVKDTLFNEPRIKKVVDLWDKLTMVLVGIGNIPSLWKDYSPLVAFSKGAIETLKRELVLYKSVGDIVQNYFDINGNISPISIRENIVGISIEQIKRVKKIIALSGGEDKKEAVLGALRWGYITHLVTDESVANYLIETDFCLEPEGSLSYTGANH